MLSKKFESMVHFIVDECKNNPAQLGAIRLNKALWFTDMLAYRGTGSSVTGEKYIKRELGPVPATILATLEKLEEEGKILILKSQQLFECTQYFSCEDPDISLLSHDERTLARSVLDYVCKQSASRISEITHEKVWEAAQEGEEIPMYATLISGKGAITDDIRKWANSAMQKIEPSAA